LNEYLSKQQIISQFSRLASQKRNYQLESYLKNCELENMNENHLFEMRDAAERNNLINYRNVIQNNEDNLQ
jgi:hypothetical protein